MKIKTFLKRGMISILTCSLLSGNVFASGAYLLGDVNNDGYITNNDRYSLNTYLKSAMQRRSSTISAEAADIDRDGQITENDSTILSRYLAGWEGYEDLSAFSVDLNVEDVYVNKRTVKTFEEVQILADCNKTASALQYSAVVYLNGTKADNIGGLGELRYTPNKPGVYSFDVTITDDKGSTYQKYLHNCLDVINSWALTDIDVSHSTAMLGQAVTLIPIVNGASDDVVYDYQFYRDDVLCYEVHDSAETSYDFLATTPGTYYAKVMVSDDNGEMFERTSPLFTVNESTEKNPVLTVNYGNTLNVDQLHKVSGSKVIVPQGNIILNWPKNSKVSYYEFYVWKKNKYIIEKEHYSKNTYTIDSSLIEPGYQYEIEVCGYDAKENIIQEYECEFRVFGAPSILLEENFEILYPLEEVDVYSYDDFTVSWTNMNYVTEYELEINYSCGR